MRSLLSATGFGLMLVTVNACAPLGTSMQSVGFSTKASTDTPASEAVSLSCLDNRVDYVLNTDVIDFEMTGGGGLKVGYSPVAATVLTGITLGVTYSTGQLQTMMHIFDPLKPGVEITNAAGTASNNNLSFSLDANISMVTFGPSFWYSTPVYTLSNNALQNNLTALGTNLNNLVKTPWWSTVSQLNGTQGFFVPVGANAGIQAGDTFNVMDVTYEWAGDGTPCTNELILPLVNSTTPKVVATAQTVGVDYTYMVITKQNRAIGIHDYVTFSKLVQPVAVACTNLFGIGCPAAVTPRTTLARSIRMGTLTTKPLSFVGQNNAVTTLDITPYVTNQLQVLLPEQPYGGFYIHQ